MITIYHILFITGFVAICQWLPHGVLLSGIGFMIAMIVFDWKSKIESPNSNKTKSKASFNSRLVPLLENIKFLRAFDKEKWDQLQSLCNAFEKEYSYVLGEKRLCTHGVSTMRHIRKQILEALYGAYISVPNILKKAPHLSPYQKIEETIESVRHSSYDMLGTVSRFCKLELSMIEPYEMGRENILP